jgi:hypothetical protein
VRRGHLLRPDHGEDKTASDRLIKAYMRTELPVFIDKIARMGQGALMDDDVDERGQPYDLILPESSLKGNSPGPGEYVWDTTHLGSNAWSERRRVRLSYQYFTFCVIVNSTLNNQRTVVSYGHGYQTHTLSTNHCAAAGTAF